MDRSQLWKTYENMQKKPNKKNEIDFFLELAQTRIYVPVSKDINKIILFSKYENKYIPIFTTMKEANKANQKTNEFKNILIKDLVLNIFMNFKEDQDFITGVLMNPLNEDIVFEAKLLIKMYKTIENKQITFNYNNFFNELQLIVPNHVPKNIKKEFLELIDKRPDFMVSKINLYKSRRSLDDSFHWLLFLNFLGNKKEFIPYISKIMRDNIKPNEAFEMCIYFGQLNYLYTLEDTLIYSI